MTEAVVLTRGTDRLAVVVADGAFTVTGPDGTVVKRFWSPLDWEAPIRYERYIRRMERDGWGITEAEEMR